MSDITPQKAVEYAFNLAYLHTKLFDVEKLPVSQLCELWEIESAIGVEESKVNNNKELRKDIILCYATLLKMFEEDDKNG